MWLMPVFVTAALVSPTDLQSADLNRITGGVACDTTGLRDKQCPNAWGETCGENMKFKQCKSLSPVPVNNIYICELEQGSINSCNDAENHCAETFDDEIDENCDPPEDPPMS
jgi:hypothetical protein